MKNLNLVLNGGLGLSTQFCAPSQYPKRRLSVRSRKVSKPQDLYLELSDRSEIWQALRQQCCRCACHISKRYDNLKYRSRGFETLRDLTERRLFGYWDGALRSTRCICIRGYLGNVPFLVCYETLAILSDYGFHIVALSLMHVQLIYDPS